MALQEERVAVLTGAASGIGAGIAGVLAREGWRLALVDRSNALGDRVEELQAAGHDVSGFRQDLLDLDALPGLCQRMIAEMGRVDALVNNAGCHFKTPDGHRFVFEAVRPEEWNNSIALHMTIPLLLAQGLLPDMVSRGWGRVINISSRAARTYLENTSASYSASKAGMLGLTRQIAGEYAARGVTCNAIAPGRVTTPATDFCAGDVRKSVLAQVLAGREGTVEEIGDAVAFLASDRAGFITGAVLEVNGGSFMAP